MFFLTELYKQLWRDIARTLLMSAIAFVLVISIGIFRWNILQYEGTLESIGEHLQVTVQITNPDASLKRTLEINTETVDELLRTGNLQEEVCTACGAGNLELINRKDQPDVCDTTITAANCLKAFPTLTADNLCFLPGWDDSALGSNQGVCLIDGHYGTIHGIALGDTISLPLYSIRYNNDQYSHRFLSLGIYELTVVGVYTTDGAGGTDQDMILPINWLRSVSEHAGEVFFYDSFRAELKDPLALNSFKEEATKIGLQQVQTDGSFTREGKALLVEDELFIQTAELLQKSIRLFQAFRGPFYLLITMIVSLVTFLILRGLRLNIAILYSLGCGKWRAGRVYYASILFSLMIGTTAGCIFLLLRGIFGQEILIAGGLNLLCGGIGAFLALYSILRVDAMELLSRRE